jgi:hypothetical protein
LEKDDEYQPLLFYSSGPDRGKPEPFPSSNRQRNTIANQLPPQPLPSNSATTTVVASLNSTLNVVHVFNPTPLAPPIVFNAVASSTSSVAVDPQAHIQNNEEINTGSNVTVLSSSNKVKLIINNVDRDRTDVNSGVEET